jgi:hypothetical protein
MGGDRGMHQYPLELRLSCMCMHPCHDGRAVYDGTAAVIDKGFVVGSMHTDNYKVSKKFVIAQ